MSVPLLPELVADEVFRLFLVFCRVGATLMLLPGFGEPYVPPRLRLFLALGLSLLLAAALGPGGTLLPPTPASPAALALLVGREVLVGLFLGTAARTLLGALHVAGMAVAYQSSLAGAAVFDPGAATQGTLPGNLLTTAALVLLFVTDAHHLLLQALAASYAVDGLEPGAMPPLGDMAELFGRLVADAFALGLRIAAPVVLVSLLLYLGLGVLNRLMPALQVFFIALPLQILLALATLMLSLAGGLLAFFAFFEDGVGRLVPGAF